MSPHIRYRFPGSISTGGTVPLVTFAFVGGWQDDAAAAPVITDLRGLPESSRTAIHRPTVPNDPGAMRGTVIYLNVDAATPQTVLTSYALPRTDSSGTPAGADLILTVGTTYSGGQASRISAALGNSGGATGEYVHVIQRISKGGSNEIDSLQAVDLNAGASVGATGNYNGGVELYTALDPYGYPARGQFLSPGNSGYVGFRFARSGQTHYGFVFIRIGSNREVIVDYVGWESAPGVAITTQAPVPVVPLPKIEVSINHTTQQIVMSWDEIVGRTYTVQQSDNLVSWGAATGTSTKTGIRRQFSSPLNQSPRRFYRVSVQ